ncbi:MAG TPA: acireductone synthase [Terracidiphilus sp.]|nr:acireductone synthase [Terracidiphilus sp.]
MSEPKLYLLDIEGTVAPLTLTTEVLFPYARAHVARFLHDHATDEDVRSDLALLAGENEADVDGSRPLFSRADQIDEALAYLLWLMDRDRKSTALKSLQGKVWKEGFETGALRGTLFADVRPALERWSVAAKVAIYSSGSVGAQRLLFRYSNFGDLTHFLSGYFDTRTGPKAEAASYRAIASDLHVEPAGILFFSDAVRELDAARSAGCQTRLVARPGNPAPEEGHGHLRIESFQQLAVSY